MKNLLLVIITLSSLNTFSQTESESTMICQSIDEFTDKKTVMGNSSVILYKDGGDMKSEGMIVDLFLSSEKNGKIKKSSLYVKVVGIEGCVDKGSTLDVIFENGEKTQLVSWKKFNCDGINYFTITKENLFKNNNIKGVKYTNKRNYQSMIVKENMNEDGKSYIKNMLLEIEKINDGLVVPGKCKE